MLTATAMQYFQSELEKAIVLTLFIPLIMSSGGNSGSQATSLLIRALALHQLKLRDWWRVALRELPTGIVLGAILGLIGVIRIAAWQWLGFYDYGEHWILIAFTVAAGLIGIVTFGSFSGSMLPFILQKLGFDPASASAPFVATLVDVTGLIIYFSVAALIFERDVVVRRRAAASTKRLFRVRPQRPRRCSSQVNGGFPSVGTPPSAQEGN